MSYYNKETKWQKTKRLLKKWHPIWVPLVIIFLDRLFIMWPYFPIRGEVPVYIKLVILETFEESVWWTIHVVETLFVLFLWILLTIFFIGTSAWIFIRLHRIFKSLNYQVSLENSIKDRAIRLRAEYHTDNYLRELVKRAKKEKRITLSKVAKLLGVPLEAQPVLLASPRPAAEQAESITSPPQAGDPPPQQASRGDCSLPQAGDEVQPESQYQSSSAPENGGNSAVQPQAVDTPPSEQQSVQQAEELSVPDGPTAAEMQTDQASGPKEESAPEPPPAEIVDSFTPASYATVEGGQEEGDMEPPEQESPKEADKPEQRYSAEEESGEATEQASESEQPAPREEREKEQSHPPEPEPPIQKISLEEAERQLKAEIARRNKSRTMLDLAPLDQKAIEAIRLAIFSRVDPNLPCETERRESGMEVAEGRNGGERGGLVERVEPPGGMASQPTTGEANAYSVMQPREDQEDEELDDDLDYQEEELTPERWEEKLALAGGDLVVAAVLLVMDNRDEWRGSPSELFVILNLHAPEGAKNRKEWPKSAGWLTKYIKRASNLLLHTNIDCDWGKGKQSNWLSLTKTS